MHNMRLETFRGPDLGSVSAQARRALGDDVMIVHTRRVRTALGAQIEVTAAPAEEIERFTRRLTPGPLPTRSRAAGSRPSVLALVGPTGAGKTTTVAKLAVHPQAMGTHRVGLLTLDTFRAGALEQLGMYAEVAGITALFRHALSSQISPGEWKQQVRRFATNGTTEGSLYVPAADARLPVLQ